MTPTVIGISVAVAGFCMALIAHIVMIARAWGSFKTIIEKLEENAEKFERLFERLFMGHEEHGTRLTRLETERDYCHRSTDKVEH